VGNEQNKIGSSTLARATQIGLTINDPAQFFLAADVDVVLLNKAGTLTAPIRRVVKSRLAYSSPLSTQSELLALAAGVELHSQHPIATSIVEEAKRQNLELPDVVDVRAIPGLGVTGVLSGETIMVGGPGLLTSRNIPIYVDDLVRSDAANQLGNSVVYVVQNSQLLGMVELSESVLPEAQVFVNELHAKKIRVAMVTGDATGVAQHVADQLNIAEVFAEIIPSRKVDVVRKLKSDSSKVAVVGKLDLDGMALSEAHVGIAIESDGLADSTAAGLHLNTSGIKVVYQTIMLAKRAKAQGTQKVLAIIGAGLLLVGSVVVILSSL
jgi:Cu2+-exporting ATPase